MELEGEQLEHMAKNRKHLQAAKGEVVAHTATCLQPVQLGCVLGSVGRGQAPLSASLVLHWPAAWWFPHGGGIWRWEPVRKYKSVWSREEVQVSTSLCHKGPGTILPRWRGHSPHPRDSETETKLNLVTARMYRLPSVSPMMVAQTACAHPGGDHVFPCALAPNLCFCLCKMNVRCHEAIFTSLPKHLLILSRQVLKSCPQQKNHRKAWRNHVALAGAERSLNQEFSLKPCPLRASVSGVLFFAQHRLYLWWQINRFQGSGACLSICCL